MSTNNNTERLQKELTQKCGGNVAQQIHVQRQAVTVNDRCSETHLTEGARRKGTMFDLFYPSAMKG